MASNFILGRPLCLRCELREFLKCFGFPLSQPRQITIVGSPTSRRAFTSQRCLREQHDATAEPSHRRPDKARRKHQVISARLKTDSLNKPSEVIMLQKVKKERTWPQKVDVENHSTKKSRANLSAKDIENSVKGVFQSSESDDVASSIETLRPVSEIVDELEYSRLVKTLDSDYTNRQLLDYLARTIDPIILNRQSSESSLGTNEKKELIMSGWKAGKTDMNQRVVKEKEIDLSDRSSAAERVLRNAWNILVQAEEQAIGELEVKLLPWQQSLLFDTQIEGRPGFESFVQSRLLLSAAEIQLYKPDNILRITARRRDAEEIAHRITSQLNQAQRLDIDLSAFEPLLGQQGRPDRVEELLSPDDLAYVAGLTNCVIAMVDKPFITIYGLKRSGREDARRLLLSFLDLPPPTSFRELNPPTLCLSQSADAFGTNVKDQTVLVPLDILKAGLHRRYHQHDLVRVVKSRASPTNDSAAQLENDTESWSDGAAFTAQGEALAATSTSIANRLAAVPPITANTDDPNQDETSYWPGGAQAVQSTIWSAHFCDILYPRSQWLKWSSKFATARNAESGLSINTDKPLMHITRHHAPKVRNLLSLLTPKDGPSSRKTIIETHFVPCPSTQTNAGNGALKLPRIAACFQYSERTDASGHLQLRLISLSAVLNEQTVDVALPQFATDVCFIRKARCIANLNRAKQDHDIRKFALQLNQSLQESSSVVSPPSSLMFQLPRWITGSTKPSPEHLGQERRTPYLLEKLQQTQQIEFEPSFNTHGDPSVLKALGPHALDGLPPNMRLNYQEVDGGATLGFFNTLYLSDEATESDILKLGMARNDSTGLDQAPPAAANELTDAVLHIAELLTRLDAVPIS